MHLEPFEVKTGRLKIAGLRNNSATGVPVIALHGWLDNAASFEPLAAYMNTDRPFYAIDLPGHGLSEHRPASCHYHLVDNIVDVMAFVDAIQTQHFGEASGKHDKVSLLGHSLGGIIASLVAATEPARIEQLILLDSMGPLTDEIESVLPQLRKAVAKALNLNSNVTVYPDLDLAIRTRMSGIGKLSREAASCLVKRGIKEVEGGFSWRSDPKLLKPSFLRLNEAQVEAIYSGIECPVKLLTGSKGYFSSEQVLNKRLTYFKNIEHISVQGGHHFHMDGEVESTARYVDEFLKI